MKIKLSQIVEDFDLYPRGDVDSQNVHGIVEAIEAGAEIPKIVICAKTRRIVDGFHRKRAWQRILGPDGRIDVIAKNYASEKELFEEAMRANSAHGNKLSRYDKTIAIEKAMRLEIDPERIASALNIMVERVTGYIQERCASVVNSNQHVPIKQPIRHMAGATMTQAQRDVVPKLGGNNALFYVNQVRILVENDLIDMSNERLVTALGELAELLGKFTPTQA